MSVTNQTIEFGGRTLASAGGAKARDNLGAQVDFVSVDSVVSGVGTNWGISSGRLRRTIVVGIDSHNAVLRCTTAQGVIDVTIKTSGLDAAGYDLAKSFSVINSTELIAAANLSNAAATPSLHLQRGDNILLRTGDGVYDAAQTGLIQRLRVFQTAFIPPTLKDPSHPRKGYDLSTGNFVTITKHVGASPVVAKFKFDGIAETQLGFRITNLVIHCPNNTTPPVPYVPTTGGAFLCAIETGGHSAHTVAIDNCEIYSELDPDLHYAFKARSGIICVAGPTWIQDNYVHHVVDGISVTGNNHTVVGNRLEYFGANGFGLSTGTDCVLAWNWIRHVALCDLYYGYHPDVWQNANIVSTGNGLQIVGNRVQLGNFTSEYVTVVAPGVPFAGWTGAQGIFGGPESFIVNGYISGTTLTITGGTIMTTPSYPGGMNTGMVIGCAGIAPGTMITGRLSATGGTGTYTVNTSQTFGSAGAQKSMSVGVNTLTNAIYAGNIIMVNWDNILSIPRGGPNTKVYNNTVVLEPAHHASEGVPSLNFASGDAVDARYNVAVAMYDNRPITPFVDTDNFYPILVADYDDWFVDPQTLGAVTDPAVQYRIKAGSQADLQSPIKAGAHSSYVNFTTRETFFPWEGAVPPPSAFNFPNAPTEGQEYTPSSGPTYVWQSNRWLIAGAGA